MTDKELQDIKHRMLMGLASEGDVKAVFAYIERLKEENEFLNEIKTSTVLLPDIDVEVEVHELPVECALPQTVVEKIKETLR